MKRSFRMAAFVVLALLVVLSGTAEAGGKKKAKKGNKNNAGRGNAQRKPKVITSKHTGIVRRLGENTDVSARHAAAFGGGAASRKTFGPVDNSALLNLIRAARAKREAEAAKTGFVPGN